MADYFQAAMWCGRMDFRVAGPPQFASPRELGSAIILNELLNRTDLRRSWEQFDAILQTFVGVSDSMTFPQLDQSLSESSLADPLAIVSGDLGRQAILSHPFKAASRGPSLALPRSFTVFGQKFVLDSWALGQLDFDRMTDKEWKDRVKGGQAPPLPEWTRDYFVPGNISIPAWAQESRDPFGF